MEQTLPAWAAGVNSLGQTAANLFAAIKQPKTVQSAATQQAAVSEAKAKWIPLALIGGIVLAVGAIVILRRK
jgi:hypothetical protein